MNQPLVSRIKIDSALVLAIVALGVTAFITQIILLREFLSVFYGNELVIGIILANWMILTGLGSLIGRISAKINDKINGIIIVITVLSIVPIATDFLLRFSRNIVFDVGSMVGIIQILYTSFILLLPFCLLSGFSFTLFSETISEKYKTNLIPKVYSFESLGSVIGGMVFSFVMIYFFETFQILLLLMVFNLIVAYILSIRYYKITSRILLIVLSLILLIGEFQWKLDEITRKFLFEDQQILYYKDTPYGNLTITQKGEQKNFYENNALLFSTNDPTMNEEAVHYAMIQHPNPKKVLLISGGISGTIDEILKYDIDKIEYAEINPWLIDIGKDYSASLFNQKVNIINQDARLFVKNTSESYDVVLINLPDPTTAQLNRYYTIEFFRELKSKLNEDAVVSFGLSSSADYLSEEARQVKSIIYNTIKKVFKNIIIVAGIKDYFLASDGELDIHIGLMIEQRGINNLYVNRYYLDDTILEQRNKFILSNLSGSTKLNEDFSPVSYYRQLLLWLSYFEVNYWIAASSFGIMLIIILFRLNPITVGMFTGGFAASSIQVVLLIAFQIMYGYVYQMLGIIIMIFMAGLAAGSLYREKIIRNTNIKMYVGIQLSIGLYAVVLPLFLLFIKTSTLSAGVLHVAFFLPTFIIAVLIGMEFSIASHIQKGTIASVASSLYGVDLIGSAIGALLITAFLIPLLGLTNACFIIGLLNFISGTISFMNRRKYLIKVI
ncbi:MAG: fused MFS/spermidine synthase [Bacteroidota bacterium]|nr:fused MFS/spermidine synthase [Bacteroidota bacterium]